LRLSASYGVTVSVPWEIVLPPDVSVKRVCPRAQGRSGIELRSVVSEKQSSPWLSEVGTSAEKKELPSFVTVSVTTAEPCRDEKTYVA